jgi:hypothetical protein
MRLKASLADPGGYYIILNSHCCQRTRSLLKFYIDPTDILLVDLRGRSWLVSQMLPATSGGKIPCLFAFA